jgi:hypothetical protein
MLRVVMLNVMVPYSTIGKKGLPGTNTAAFLVYLKVTESAVSTVLGSEWLIRTLDLTNQ